MSGSGYRSYCGGREEGSACAFDFPSQKRIASGFRMIDERRLFGLPARNTGNCRKLGSTISIERSLAEYGKVYVIQPYREQEKCSPACQNATGHECQCSCMGLYHGAGNDGSWFEVSDTFAARWGEQELACRLMTAR